MRSTVRFCQGSTVCKFLQTFFMPWKYADFLRKLLKGISYKILKLLPKNRRIWFFFCCFIKNHNRIWITVSTEIMIHILNIDIWIIFRFAVSAFRISLNQIIFSKRKNISYYSFFLLVFYHIYYFFKSKRKAFHIWMLFTLQWKAFLLLFFSFDGVIVTSH